MASLIVKYDGAVTAAMFHQRVLIGRKPFNGVQLGNRDVSRIHAWIDWAEDHYFICDSHSRGGTTVNGQPALGKTVLNDGDTIGIGPAQIIFHLSDILPFNAVTFDISTRGTNPEFKNAGILMQCDCGAPLWVPASMAGAFGKCATCKGDITVPGVPLSGVRRPLTPNDSIVDMPAIKELGSEEAPDDPLAAGAFPRPKPAAANQICGICQTPIETFEATETCPACSQRYHAECWSQNRGCAAYGCTHVGVLDAAEDMSLVAAAVTQQAPKSARLVRPAPAPARITSHIASRQVFPWDFVLLGGSVLGSIVGAFTFGVPALALGLASAVYAIRGGTGRKSIAALAVAICAVGGVAGIVASRVLWFNAPLLAGW
jgi:pSer/pThr/pTyr-binding forkhead associated (FHA) protein